MSSNNNHHNLWLTKPEFKLSDKISIYGELLYKKQMDDITNNLLLEDNGDVLIHEGVGGAKLSIKGMNMGEVIAGSALTHCVNSAIDAQDVDIYFHSKEDALKWSTYHHTRVFIDKSAYPRNPPEITDSEFCANTEMYGIRFNLIWGLTYTDAKSLIAGFDIRACAIAYDPNTDKAYHVHGALQDCFNKHIIFQTNARVVSVARLIKYINKGLTIDKYQRSIFAELIKSGKHDRLLELITGYGEKK